MIIPFYPILFALYPVINLLAQNISQINPIALTRPLVFSLGLSLAIWLLAYALLRSWQKSALLVFAFQVFFFTFGHLLHLFSGFGGFSPTGGGNGVLTSGEITLALVELGLLVALAVWLSRTKVQLKRVTTYLVTVNLILLAFPLFRIGEYYWNAQRSANGLVARAAGLQNVSEKPDIYFIVLDAYSRQDLLKAHFNFDNSSFINQLTDLGFKVIPCSRSNYNGTAVSLSSMLNMQYLHDLGVIPADLYAGKDPLTPLIMKNQVRTSLAQVGYQIYNFQNDFPGLVWHNTSETFGPAQDSIATQNLLPIENLFIKSTAMDLLLDVNTPWNQKLKATVDSPFADHIQLVQYIISKLAGTATLPGPKFVYGHLILPHKPFVFDAQGNIVTDIQWQDNGNPVDWSAYDKGYIAQVHYANSQIIPILTQILRYSQKPPIIILLGDHGFAAGDTQFQNLLALYIPDPQVRSQLYPTLSNINVFRLLFDSYFGGSYPLLPDVSYRMDKQKGWLVVQENLPDCSR